MKKKLVMTALSATLLLSSTPVIPSSSVHVHAASMTGEVIFGVNFRTAPSTSSGSIIRMLSRGEHVEITEQVNDYWYKIRDERGRVGYVSSNSKYIRLNEAAPVPDAEAYGEVIYGVNFRTAPSTSTGSIIRMLSRGEQVDILEKASPDWYKVRDKHGRVGYVSSKDKYIRVTGSVPEPNDGAHQGGSDRSSASGEVVFGVNFRTAPSTSSGSVIRMLSRGEHVDILEKVSPNWYKVRDKHGRVGYVSSNSKYIRVDGTIPQPGTGDYDSGDVDALVQQVIAAGMKYLGTPYEYGSDRNSTATFDCSAFVRRAFIEGAGITLPMDSRQQGDYVKQKGNTTTNWRDLKPGDLMFFMSYRGPKRSDYNGVNKSNQRITHDGIYIGDGKILHTYSKESGGVRIDSIEGKHWEYRFLFGGSAL